MFCKIRLLKSSPQKFLSIFSNRSVSSLFTSSLCALQNLISVLPVEEWGDTANLASMWSFLFAMLEKGPAAVSGNPGILSGMLVALHHVAAERKLLVTPIIIT